MDKDIQEMFQEKNKAILLNNLKYDLEKNINSLLETIINIFNLEYDTAIKNMNTILDDSELLNDSNFIQKLVSKMKLDDYEKLEFLLNQKKVKMEEYIQCFCFTEEDLSKYYSVVFDSTKLFKQNFNEYIISIVEQKQQEILKQFPFDKISKEKEKVSLTRIIDYLSNRLYGKLETKIHMEVMIRDNHLINKAKESYLRYLEICSKTSQH